MLIMLKIQKNIQMGGFYMNIRICAFSFFSVLILLSTTACSTKTTLSLPENVPYKTYTLKQLPPQVEKRAKELKQQKISSNDETPNSILFYTNDISYVLITSGWKPTGGYSIRINRVSPDTEGVIIYASDIPPAKGAMVEQVISAPLLTISIPHVKNAKVIWE